MRTVVGVVLAACAVALVVAAALGSAPLLVLPVPWGVGLIGVAMLAVAAQPSATRAARTAARVLCGLGVVGALAAWGSWLAGYDRPASPGGMPGQVDSVVDLGASVAALSLAALVVVALSAGSRSEGPTEPEQPALSAGA